VATTAAATTASGSSIYHGWGLDEGGEGEEEGGGFGHGGGGRAWDEEEEEEEGEEGVWHLSVADPGLDASVETVVERFPRCCWLGDERPPLSLLPVGGAAVRGPSPQMQQQAREAPF
jgi:hypothetical protein